MGDFKDLGDWEASAGLELPLRGRHHGKRVYRIAPLSAELGPTVQRMLTTGIALGMQSMVTPQPSDDNDTETADGPMAETRAAPAAEFTAEDVAGLQKVLLSDEQEQSLFEQVLGPAYQQMIDDGVAWVVLKHAALVAMFDGAFGREAAIRLWEAGPGKPAGRPAAAPKPRARTGTGSRTSTGSTAGTTTRTPSTTGGSTGGRSSSAGR